MSAERLQMRKEMSSVICDLEKEIAVWEAPAELSSTLIRLSLYGKGRYAFRLAGIPIREELDFADPVNILKPHEIWLGLLRFTRRAFSPQRL